MTCRTGRSASTCGSTAIRSEASPSPPCPSLTSGIRRGADQLLAPQVRLESAGGTSAERCAAARELKKLPGERLRLRAEPGGRRRRYPRELGRHRAEPVVVVVAPRPPGLGDLVGRPRDEVP